VIASPDGDIVWVSGPLPGAIHDLTAARIWGILRELAAPGLVVLADKGYHGAGDHVRTPYRGRNKPTSQKTANRAHAKLRGPGERANAQLKTWRLLQELRCCPWRAGQWFRSRKPTAVVRDRRPHPRTRRCRCSAVMTAPAGGPAAGPRPGRGEGERWPYGRGRSSPWPVARARHCHHGGAGGAGLTAQATMTGRLVMTPGPWRRGLYRMVFLDGARPSRTLGWVRPLAPVVTQAAVGAGH
jgi:DDE superfamily endonuclease